MTRRALFFASLALFREGAKITLRAFHATRDEELVPRQEVEASFRGEEAVSGNEALVEPALLVWARTAMNYSPEAAAKKLRVSPAKLAAWEGGQERPTIPQLRELAAVYRRPLAVFFLPEPPKNFTPMHDFRTSSAGGGALARSPELSFSIRTAHERRETAIELLADMDTSPRRMTLRAAISEPTDVVANRLRSLLGVSIEQQFEAKRDGESYALWRRAIEDAGVLVFQMSKVEWSEARGLSIGADELPVIVVNARDTYYGRTFTLLHEMCHLALREDGICNLAEGEFPTRTAQKPQVERYCNAVAAATLMPTDVFASEARKLMPAGGGTWANRDTAFLSRKFGASEEAVVRRLNQLGLASDAFCRRRCGELAALYAKRVDRERESRGGPTQDVLTIARNGVLFSRLVLDAYHSGVITASEVSDCLRVKTKHFESIEASLRRLGGAYDGASP